MLDNILLRALILNGIEGAPDFASGNNADKNSVPVVGQTYFAVDNKKIYYCEVAGTWIEYVVGSLGVKIVVTGDDIVFTNAAGTKSVTITMV